MAKETKNRSKLNSLSSLLLILGILIFALWIGKSLIMPVVFAIFLAMMFMPITNFFERFIKNDAIAIILTFISILIPVVLLATVFGYQLSTVFEGMSSIGERLDEGIQKILVWLKRNIGINIESPRQFAEENTDNLAGFASNFLTSSISSTTGVLINIGLGLIYIFFILLYRRAIKNFLIQQVPKEYRSEGKNVIHSVRRIAQQYLIGTITVMGILAVLNSLGLWIIGVDYAVFWGCLGAFLAIIPYIGTIIGGLLPLIYVLATSNGILQPIAVIVLYQVVQAVEGNFITPKIVGSNVSINTLVAIMAILFWGTLWGVGGVILAIPLTAIFKIFLGQVSYFEPLSYLMSDGVNKKPQVFLEKYDAGKYRIWNYFKPR
ncbi:MAG: AI-2E family transporter [Bacteroidota bacterium]